MQSGFALYYTNRKGRELVTNLRYLSPTVILPDEITCFERDEVASLNQTQDHITFIAREDRNVRNLKGFLDYLKGKKSGSGRYRIARASLGPLGDLFLQPTEDDRDDKSIFCTFFPRGYNFPIPHQQQPQPQPQTLRMQNPTRSFLPPPFVTTQSSQTADYITRLSDPRVSRAQSQSAFSLNNNIVRVPSPRTSRADNLECVTSPLTETTSGPVSTVPPPPKETASTPVPTIPPAPEPAQLEEDIKTSKANLEEALRKYDESNERDNDRTPFEVRVYLAKDSLPGGIHPSFLNTVAQVHSAWILGAFGELIHNCADAGATALHIDVQEVGSTHTRILILKDNGQGMDRLDMIRLMNFGHGELKKESESGKFGVGFKTGAMALAREALVLSITPTSRSIAFLSQRFNQDKKTMVIPVVSYCLTETAIELDPKYSPREGRVILSAISSHSVFQNENDLLAQFSDIGVTGTKIILFDIQEEQLDFSSADDIRVAKVEGKNFVRNRTGLLNQETPLDYSLRACLALVFLRPRMVITLRGTEVIQRKVLEPVTDKMITSEYKGGKFHSDLILYYDNEEAASERTGFHIYWHGVLILSYHRVGLMVSSPMNMQGIIGVIEDNNLNPLNSKTEFVDDENFRSLNRFLAGELEKFVDKGPSLQSVSPSASPSLSPLLRSFSTPPRPTPSPTLCSSSSSATTLINAEEDSMQSSLKRKANEVGQDSNTPETKREETKSASE